MKRLALLSFLVSSAFHPSAHGAEDVMITGVPDYAWHAGCFGTAAGNLMGYWDRNGLPDFYTGPTGNGLAPLNSSGQNLGIRSLWASQAGVDGRPLDKPGHINDYWSSDGGNLGALYESTDPDPYAVEGRAEHEPDCLGDFMGSSQNKWSNFDGECAGNINAYSFNYWDKQGALRVNFTPPTLAGNAVRDVQSGLRQWAHSRGYEALVASQLVDFNPAVPKGKGFSFQDLKAEILRGYPVVLILQNPGQFSRNLPGLPRGNPNIHAMLAFHFQVTDDGYELVQYRTSWASGEASLTWSTWSSQVWAAELDLRGVVLFRPLPKITGIERANGKLTIRWEGPRTTLWDDINQIEVAAHAYAIESASTLNGRFTRIGGTTTDLEITVPDPGADHLFFRVKLASPAYDGLGGL